jgi:hypothetical protein
MRYCEAFCRLPVSALYRSHDLGNGELVWRDSTGGVIGSAKVMSRSGGLMHVAFAINPSGAVEAYAGEVAVDFVFRDAGMHRREVYAICPGCRGTVKQLIGKDHRWLCRSCHGLVNRSSLIRHNARLTEKVEQLEAKVGRGRPKGMHNATYERLTLKLAEYRERLGENALRADSRFDHVVTHQIAGVVENKKEKVTVKNFDQFSLLFSQRLIAFFNQHFIANANEIVNGVPADLRNSLRAHLIDMITRNARILPLVLGQADEFIEASSAPGLCRTIVEVSFSGNAGLLQAHSEVSPSLPPCFGQVDEEARVIRFILPGSVKDQPVLRVRMDEQLAVLREQVARQARALVGYHDALQLNATGFLDSRPLPPRR